MSEPTPRRVRVTNPRTDAPRQRRVAGTSEIDEQTGVGAIYMSSLLRSQLRLALMVLFALGVLVGGLPLLFAVAPAVQHARLFDVPVPWLLLAFAVYPLMIGLGWLYVRAAERNESDFAEVVDRS